MKSPYFVNGSEHVSLNTAVHCIAPSRIVKICYERQAFETYLYFLAYHSYSGKIAGELVRNQLLCPSVPSLQSALVLVLWGLPFRQCLDLSHRARVSGDLSRRQDASFFRHCPDCRISRPGLHQVF